MNNSWASNSQNSPGFLYFNVNTTPTENQGNTPDFIPFGDSPQQLHSSHFTPQNYSSPHHYRGRPYMRNKRNWSQNRYSTGKYENRSYGSSNNSYNSSFNSPNASVDNSTDKHKVFN